MMIELATVRRRMLAAVVVLGAGLVSPGTVWPAENPAFWKYTTEGDFDTVVENLKSGLSSAQFVITQQENLSRGLENNKDFLGGDAGWNTIGFARVTTVHFCSLVFNHKVFNIDIDWSVLCPFKVTAYSMRDAPERVTLIMVRPAYVLAGDPREQAQRIGREIEQRIVEAIRAGVDLR